MIRKTWEEVTGEIKVMLEEVGLEWHHLRNEVGRLECESGRWPAEEGMGSSDMNCLTVSAWEADPEELCRLAQKVAAREQLRRTIEEAGIDLNALRRLFEPA